MDGASLVSGTSQFQAMGGMADVADDRMYVGYPGQLLVNLFQFRRSTCVDDQLPAPPGQLASQGQAQTSRGSGDQGSFG
jgi:hypothetical protein